MALGANCTLFEYSNSQLDRKKWLQNVKNMV